MNGLAETPCVYTILNELCYFVMLGILESIILPKHSSNLVEWVL